MCFQPRHYLDLSVKILKTISVCRQSAASRERWRTKNAIELHINLPSFLSSSLIGWVVDKVRPEVSVCSPSLEIPSCPGHRRAWLSQVPPGTLSARKSSPRQISAGQRRWAACVSSSRPCQSGQAGLEIYLVSHHINVIQQDILPAPWGEGLGDRGWGLENRNLILSLLAWWCYPSQYLVMIPWYNQNNIP